MTQVKKTLKLTGKRRPLRIHTNSKGKRYIKVNSKKYFLADNVKGNAKKAAYKLLRNLIGETIERRLKKSYRKATKTRKPRRPMANRKPKKTKEPKQEPQATPTYNPFAPNLSSVMAPVMRNPMQTYNLFLPGGMMETVRAQLEDVKKEQQKLIENKEQKLLDLPPIGTPPKSPRKILPLDEEEYDPESFMKAIEAEALRTPPQPKKLLDRVKDAFTSKKEEKKDEIRQPISLQYEPLPIGQPDKYYANISYLDENDVESNQPIIRELPLNAKEFQKKNSKLYQMVLGNKKLNKASEFKENQDGFDFFKKLFESKYPNLKNKITKITIVNRTLLPRGDGRNTDSRKTEGEGGLYDDEINAKMKHWQHFQGTIMRDELGEFFETAIKNEWDRFGVIVNTDVSSGPGQHWTAIFVDLYKDRSVEFFDPFGDPPHETIEHDIKNYIDALDLPFMLKYKVNSNKLQHEKSDRCGLHAMLFLEDRFRGIPFGEATGYEKKEGLIKKSEARAERRKKGFGYV